MRISKICLLLAVGLLAGVLVMRTTQAQPAVQKAQPTAVAVCNIVDVYNDYDKARTLKAEFERRQKEIETEDRAKLEKLTSLEKELSDLKPDSEQYETAFAEFQKQAVNREAWRKFQESVLMRQQQKLMKEMYTDVIKAIDDVAKESGYQVVLFREPPDVSAEGADLLAQIERRKVLYCDKSVDITLNVKQRLNNNYKASIGK